MPEPGLLLGIPLLLFRDILAKAKAVFNSSSVDGLMLAGDPPASSHQREGSETIPRTSVLNFSRSRRLTWVERRRCPRTKGALESAGEVDASMMPD